ncbi:NUDIX hydrolase [Leptospira wolffii]|uniref:NUDIX hydrolase n=1 Tax=Leptospira wolffii TaxID=409998 RepID=A0A2M9ZF39_9LEPT|nr:NUDIX domain-containing protein [Leptospira wolffii]PJZ67023.1 NUDIX hydrolase [Leptospira wolffii]TGK61997.1 NUDIX hydrolase [Leptospira wolffii]TGK68598.1 NUDIX hydrolase [Leptospira wolffii]TGK74618.1 NUDIX hydrolase [Leptospira wolffii]TGL31806.1 NUDIX hydrolase [Leptospira wolffii]
MSKHGFFQITQKVFLRKGSELLILRDRKSGFGDLPGGRMNEDEFYGDWLESLSRELKEEMGEDCKIKIHPKPILIHKHRVNDGNHPCVIVAYHGEFLSGEIKLSDEHDYIAWVDAISYDPSQLFFEYMLDAIRLYQKEYAPKISAGKLDSIGWLG